MKSSRNSKSERGTELVEFAFAITILLSLMFGIIGFAQAAYAYHFVSDVAREATRYASVRGSDCNPAVLPDCPMNTSAQVETYAKSIAPLGINATQLTVNATWPSTGGCPGPATAPGCPVQVQVQYPFTFLPVLHLGTLNISSTSQMVITQ